MHKHGALGELEPSSVQTKSRQKGHRRTPREDDPEEFPFTYGTECIEMILSVT